MTLTNHLVAGGNTQPCPLSQPTPVALKPDGKTSLVLIYRWLIGAWGQGCTIPPGEAGVGKSCCAPFGSQDQGQTNTSWRQPEIWGKYLQCLKIKGRVSARASRCSQHVQLLSWFPSQSWALSPRAPRASGVRWGQHWEGHAAHSCHSAVTELHKNKLPVVSAMENMQERSFPQCTLALSSAGAELLLCPTPSGPRVHLCASPWTRRFCEFYSNH